VLDCQTILKQIHNIFKIFLNLILIVFALICICIVFPFHKWHQQCLLKWKKDDKNIWQRCKQIWTHFFSVVTYDIVSYYSFLKTVLYGELIVVISDQGRAEVKYRARDLKLQCSHPAKILFNQLEIHSTPDVTKNRRWTD
jgi:hypothetical protein